MIKDKDAKNQGYHHFWEDSKKSKHLFQSDPEKLTEFNQDDLSNMQINSTRSAWNESGTTFEEKDMTDLVKQKLKSNLLNIPNLNNDHIEITSIIFFCPAR